MIYNTFSCGFCGDSRPGATLNHKIRQQYLHQYERIDLICGQTLFPDGIPLAFVLLAVVARALSRGSNTFVVISIIWAIVGGRMKLNLERLRAPDSVSKPGSKVGSILSWPSEIASSFTTSLGLKK